MTQLEKDIKTEIEKRLFKLASSGVSDPAIGEETRIKAAVEVCKRYVGIAQDKTIGYCQILKRSDGYIPWSDVKRYNREFKDNL